MSGACNIPSRATSFSLKYYCGSPAGGILQYLTIHPTGSVRPNVSTLNDYLGTVVANAAIVQAGNSGQVTIYVTDTTDVIIDVDGYFLGQTGFNGNTAIGQQALQNDSSGIDNTAVGKYALIANTSGSGKHRYWVSTIGI